MGKRIVSEVLATAAVLATLAVWYQLRDPLSPLRLKVEEGREAVREWSIRYRVDSLIDNANAGGETQ